MRDEETKTVASACENLAVRALGDVWHHLAAFQMTAEVAEIHRGIEWNIALKENMEQLVSSKLRPGFKRGVSPARGMRVFHGPERLYLRFGQKYRRRNAYDLPWGQPKVLINVAPMSRGPWRVAAFSDEEGLVARETFYGIWPTAGWSAKALAAVLNGPVANAFVSVGEGKRKIRKKTLAKVPLPGLSAGARERLELLVDKYLASTAGANFNNAGGSPRQLLCSIDALVLSGYGLPPRLERQLLEFFRGEQRPTPFDFGDYFPADFESYVPLHLYLSGEYRRSAAASVRTAFERLPRHNSVRQALEAAVEAFEE